MAGCWACSSQDSGVVPALTRRRVLLDGSRGLVLLGLLGAAVTACGSSGPAGPDPTRAAAGVGPPRQRCGRRGRQGRAAGAGPGADRGGRRAQPTRHRADRGDRARGPQADPDVERVRLADHDLGGRQRRRRASTTSSPRCAAPPRAPPNWRRLCRGIAPVCWGPSRRPARRCTRWRCRRRAVRNDLADADPGSALRGRTRRPCSTPSPPSTPRSTGTGSSRRTAHRTRTSWSPRRWPSTASGGRRRSRC